MSISSQIHQSHVDTKIFNNYQQIGLLFKVTTRISSGQKDYKEAHDTDSSKLNLTIQTNLSRILGPS